MAQRAGNEPFLNVGVQVTDPPAAHGLDEILIVVAGAAPLFDLVALLVVGRGTRIIRDKDISAFALDDDADTGPLALFVRRKLVHVTRIPAFVGLARFIFGESAHFKDQRRFWVVVKDDLSVRGLTIVIVAQSAADAPDPGREFGLAEKPPGDVHLMDSLVAEIAVAVIPEPMPVVVKALSLNRGHRRRAAPQIVINVGWRLLRGIDLADARAGFVTQAAGEDDSAEVTGANPLDGLLDREAGAALGAGLNDSLVFARGFDQLVAFPDFMADGLFHIDIFARLHGPEGGQGVPVVRRGNGNSVDVVLLQQLPDVAEGSHPFILLAE